MGNIKKRQNNKWGVIASGKATGIAVDNPIVLNENENIASVDTILERHQEAIDKLQRNVAWLALHGGGGAGGTGGGGSDITDAECIITVNEALTGEQVILNLSEGLTVQLHIDNVQLTKAWKVVIRIGSTQILQTVASRVSPIISVQSSRIVPYLQNHRGRLTVEASYEDDQRGIYGSAVWIGNIVENAAVLTSINYGFNIANVQQSQVLYKYSVGVFGIYTLNINILKNGQSYGSYQNTLNIVSSEEATYNIPVTDLLSISGNTSDSLIAGVYTLNASLTYSEDPRVSTECISTMTLISESILISSSVLSTDITHPTEVNLSGNINAVWTAYLLGASTFEYSYKINNTVIKENAIGYFETQIQDRQSVLNKEWAVANSTVSFTITVRSSDKLAYVTYYLKFIQASDEFLQEQEDSIRHLLTDFEARNQDTGVQKFTITNNGYYNNTVNYPILSTILMLNKNSLSVISADLNGTPYLRISNGAYAKIDQWTFNGRTYTLPNLITSEAFTISLCFKADYHPDDLRTILYTGLVDVDTGKLSNGISIDVHNIYIGTKSVVTLIDNEINQIDIVVKRIVENSTTEEILKIYLDGVLTFVSSTNSLYNNISQKFEFGDAIFLGGRQYTNNAETVYDLLCDCNIYSLKIYDKAISDFDVMINYINNKVASSYISNLPNFGIIDSELKKNFCGRDNQGNIESYLYNVNNNNYGIDFLLGTDSSSNTILDENQLLSYAKAVGLPIVFIDVSSNVDWTFDQFVTLQTAGDVSLNTAIGMRVQYWDPNGSNTGILNINGVSIGLQGTSTLADSVKNINITLPNDTVFIPKDTWFPEQTYTLKADVVDSSHSNNASIGKFINEKLGLNGGASFFGYDPQAVSNVNSSQYKLTQQPTVTLKHTVEGFPVFVIMKFHVEAGQGSGVSVTPLGIYSFNIGREAYRNIGFKKLNSITKGGEAIEINSFPFLDTQVAFNESPVTARWIEVNDNLEVNSIVGLTLAGWDTDTFDTSKGDFWQDDVNIVRKHFSVRYPKSGDGSLIEDTTLNSTDSFVIFIRNIMKLPVEAPYTTDSSNRVLTTELTSAYKLYTLNGDAYVTSGKSWQIDSNYSGWGDRDKQGYNIQSMYRYFTIGLLFGLVDNFSKNSTYRSWKTDGSWGNYYIDFYDLDTALGCMNQGSLDVKPAVWIKYLYNKPFVEQDGTTYAYAAETYDSALSGMKTDVVTGKYNKIWMSLDTSNYRSFIGDTSNSAYTSYWYQLRTELDNIMTDYNEENHTDYKDFADFFVDVYFSKLTGNCGPLLFNYDYRLKYLLQFQGETYKETKDLSKLHGRKIAHTRYWLKQHIQFLDSLFRWRDTGLVRNFKNDVSNSAANSVFGTVKQFPMTSNAPIIMHCTIGDQAKSYYFMNKNEETMINAGGAPQSEMNWNFSNSSNIIKIGNDKIPLSAMNVRILSYSPNPLKLNEEGYHAITELDLHDNNVFGSDFSLKAFLVDNAEVSELRILNFKDTSSINGNTFKLVLTEENNGQITTRYKKLLKIDISGSTFVTDLVLPDIPLVDLKIANSSIQNFVLKDLKYIEQVDLTGCNALLTVDIRGCDSYTQLVLLNKLNLRSVKVLNCPSITRIVVSDCPNLQILDIESNKQLLTILISGCTGLIGEEGDNYVTIQECPVLDDLSITNCVNLTTVLLSNINQQNLSGLQLVNTKIAYITGDNAENDDKTLLDLSAFQHLLNLSIQTNTAVTRIQLYNDINNPIPLYNTFVGCSNLTRIYGNMEIRCNSCFQSLHKFSIHGIDTTRWNNYTIKASGITRMPYKLRNANATTIDAKNIQWSNLFILGKAVTNMKVIAPYGTNTFYGTAYRIFDVYYIMSSIEGNVSLLGMFYGERSNANSSFYHEQFSFANSPDRNMFAKCENCTNFTNMFYNTGGEVRLLSPTYENGVCQDDGLFSPIGNNVTVTLMQIWASSSKYFDKNLFRMSGDNKKRISNLQAFSPVVILPVGYSGNTAPTLATYKAALESDIDCGYGDLSNFFDDFDTDNVDNLSIYGFCNTTAFLDYRKPFKVPKNVTEIRSCFIATYSIGELILEDRFESIDIEGTKNIQKIYQSFRTINEITRLSPSLEPYKTVFNIESNVLSKFKNLKALSYFETGSYIGTNETSSINGNGIVKLIHQNSFPFDIIKYLPNLEEFVGFFLNCTLASGYTISNLELPGDLFKLKDTNNNFVSTKLTILDSLFNGFKIPYTLTSDSLQYCTNINKVAKMFADSAVTGNIPARLLFHGWQTQNQTITKKGTNTVTGQEGEYEGTEETATLTGVNIPNKNITSVLEIFRGCRDLTPYLETNPVPEKNEYWNPWTYVLNTQGNWVENTEKDTQENTVKWVYDGDYIPSAYSSQIATIEDGSKTGSLNVLTPNDSSNFRSGGIQVPTAIEPCPSSYNFICPPDLLRYCKNTSTTNVQGLFKDCGQPGNSTQYTNNGVDPDHDGIYGRICPWMLEPVSLITSIKEMFQNCRRISYYKVLSGKSYTIPKDFLAYAPKIKDFTSAFRGMAFPGDIDLNVFRGVQANTSKILDYIFAYSYFAGTSEHSTEISEVFTRFKNLDSIYCAFACYGNVLNSASHHNVKDQYITFNNVFASGYDNSAQYGSGNYNTTHYGYVFAGYRGSTVTFTNKTLVDNTTTNNYTYVRS